jgi:hypothetical protein
VEFASLPVEWVDHHDKEQVDGGSSARLMKRRETAISQSSDADLSDTYSLYSVKFV